MVTDRPVIGLLALQGDIREHAAAFRDCGESAQRVRNLGDLASVDALVIPGGESTTITKLAHDWGLFDPIVERIGDGMPVYGSCAGMIMIADRVSDGIAGQRGFGGIDMAVRRNAFGRQVDSFETQVTMPIIGTDPIHGIFIRAPWVECTGVDVEVLATVVGRDGEDRIVAVRQGRLLATAFHPELTNDRRVHKLFVEMVRGADRGTDRGTDRGVA